jgi:UDP-glucose:(heptosyl)LPS alpha-1,3-glucosyltransferase
VLSIAHTAVSRETGRLRYRPFASMPGFEVHLLAPSRWKQFGRTFTADPAGDPGVALHIEPIRLPKLPGVKWYGHFYPGLGKIIEAVQPDVIHLWEEPWSVVALQAALLRRGAALVIEADQNILKRLPPPFETIRRFVLRRTSLVLSRSPDATAVVRACGFAGPVRPIGYGVDCNVFAPSREPAPARPYGAPLRMGYVGRLIEEKGLGDALTAMTLTPVPIELAVMGEGPYESRLRSWAEELGFEARVSFRGWGSPREVAGFIRSCDITLLLTRTTGAVREQFGRAIIESQACGVPVVGSSCGAIPDVVAAGGWIVPENDPGALALLLGRLAMAPEEIASCAANGLKNVAERFTYPAVANALAAAFTEADGLRGVIPAKASQLSWPGLYRPSRKDCGASKRLAGSSPAMTTDVSFRIVQAVQEFSTEGGVETVAFELAKAWDRAGVPNSVLASAGDAAKVQRVAPWLARIPTRGALRHIGRFLVVPLFTLAVTLALRKHRSAVIVSHGDSLTGDVLIVHAVNAVSLDEKKRAGNWRWLLNPIHLWVALRDRFMIGGRRYRRYVAVSPRVAGELEAYYKVPRNLISVIPNGIDLSKFNPDPAMRNVIRDEFGIPHDARLLLFVGHEFARKGLAYAVEALKQLDDDVCLLVVGSDNPAPYRRLLPDADKRLFFAGARKDLPAFYQTADAFVLPTAYETFSLVCMEALASGVPVLATRVGGIEDYLEDGVNGYGIERDAADIAARVRSVLGDPAKLAVLKGGARATAERFDWNTVAARYAALLKEVWQAKMHIPAAAPAPGGSQTMLAH